MDTSRIQAAIDRLRRLDRSGTPEPWVPVDGGLSRTVAGGPLLIIRDPLLLANHCNLQIAAAARNQLSLALDVIEALTQGRSACAHAAAQAWAEYVEGQVL